MMLKYAIALAVVLVLALVFTWAFLPARYLPGNRARHLRIRLHLRLHPSKGFAHVVGLWLRWGRLAMLRRSGQIRPSLPLWYRIAEPHQHSVFLGRAHYRHVLRAPLEEHLLVMSPPRMLKTAFAFAVSQKGVEDGTFWSAKASDYLRAYFHAAALARHDLRTVAEWVSGASPDVPERILMAAGARQWAVNLAELRSEAHKTTATVRMVMTRALSFMADPALAASVLPTPGTGFDIPAFLEDRGTVYLIAEALSEQGLARHRRPPGPGPGPPRPRHPDGHPRPGRHYRQHRHVRHRRPRRRTRSSRPRS